MKVFQSNLFYILKGIFLLVATLFCFINLNAQVTLRIEPGILLETDSDNLGLLLNIEPKVKASEHIVIGLRFGIVTNPCLLYTSDAADD